MPDTITEKSTPIPSTQILVFTAIRAGLIVLGSFGITWGAGVSQEAWMIIAGGIATLIGVAWSFWQKIQQAKLDHAGNVASARGGVAVKVVEQDGVPPI